MNANLLIACRWLQTVALSLWIGGILVIGAIVAPVAFRHSGLTTAEAGNVVGGSLSHLNILLYLTGGVLLLAQGAEDRIRPSRDQIGKRLRYAVALGMLGLALLLGLVFMPTMLADRAAGRMAEFDRLHHRYEFLSQAQFFLALGLAWLNARTALLKNSSNPPLPSDPMAVPQETISSV